MRLWFYNKLIIILTWNTPTFERNELYSAQSHFQIISENMMKHTKEYASCRDKLRYHLMKEDDVLKIHHENWTIAAAFVNLYNKRAIL